MFACRGPNLSVSGSIKAGASKNSPTGRIATPNPAPGPATRDIVAGVIRHNVDGDGAATEEYADVHDRDVGLPVRVGQLILEAVLAEEVGEREVTDGVIALQARAGVPGLGRDLHNGGFVPERVVGEHIDEGRQPLERRRVVVHSIRRDVLDDVDDDPGRVLVHARSSFAAVEARVLGCIVELLEADES
jgi:hypothetical protein